MSAGDIDALFTDRRPRRPPVYSHRSRGLGSADRFPARRIGADESPLTGGEPRRIRFDRIRWMGAGSETGADRIHPTANTDVHAATTFVR